MKIKETIHVSILLLIGLSLLSACGGSTNEESNGTKNDTASISDSLQIKEITRAEAGFTRPAKHDFDERRIHPYILRWAKDPYGLLNDTIQPQSFTVINGVLMVDETWTSELIAGCKMGNSQANWITVLGKPEHLHADTAYWTLGNVGVMTKGIDSISLVYFCWRENRSLASDFLLQIMRELYNNESPQTETLMNEFEHCSHITGGGVWGSSTQGIEFSTFENASIDVWSNYDGALFKSENPRYKLQYHDCDVRYKTIIDALSSIENYNQMFADNENISADGRYSALDEDIGDFSRIHIMDLTSERPLFYIRMRVSKLLWDGNTLLYKSYYPVEMENNDEESDEMESIDLDAEYKTWLDEQRSYMMKLKK